ncbi:hypothetical protein [Pseudomonas sp. B16120]|uniref:hypothetical protein n=1 Tax=Pseudomonas sp. B16120 TaxID=3235108 RepID=UPI003784E708
MAVESALNEQAGVDCLTDGYLKANFADSDVEECGYCKEERPVVALDELGAELEGHSGFIYLC